MINNVYNTTVYLGHLPIILNVILLVLHNCHYTCRSCSTGTHTNKYLNTFDDESLSRPKELDDAWCYISSKNATKRSTNVNRFVTCMRFSENNIIFVKLW